MRSACLTLIRSPLVPGVDGTFIWTNIESSAGLKVSHDELAVLAVIRAGIAVGSFSGGCAAGRGLRCHFRRAGR